MAGNQEIIRRQSNKLLYPGFLTHSVGGVWGVWGVWGVRLLPHPPTPPTPRHPLDFSLPHPHSPVMGDCQDQCRDYANMLLTVQRVGVLVQRVDVLVQHVDVLVLPITQPVQPVD